MAATRAQLLVIGRKWALQAESEAAVTARGTGENERRRLRGAVMRLFPSYGYNLIRLSRKLARQIAAIDRLQDKYGFRPN